jgi:Ca-activated chloride channel family protein
VFIAGCGKVSQKQINYYFGLIFVLILAMKIILSLLSISFFFNFHAQLVFEKTNLNFGELNAQSEYFLDIEVKNSGIKKEYFLSFRKPAGVIVLSKGQYVLPDSTTFVRVQVNPSGKGRFQHKIEIFTSDRDKATILTVSGNVLDLPYNASADLQSCPDFNVRPAKSVQSNLLTVKTIDKNTRELIDAQVFLIQNGVDVSSINTKKGIWKDKFPLGFTYFYAKSANYRNAEMSAYVNANRNEVLIELEKNPETEIVEPAILVVVEPIIAEKLIPEKEIIIVEEKSKPEVSLRKELQTAKVKNDSISIPVDRELAFENFSDENFKAVNLVFVIDVSSSMASKEKFDLLKFSLNELSTILRKQDKISFVTYSSEASVLMESISGIEKEEIQKQIKELKAFGYTAGSAGIKLGFKELEKNFIADGMNTIIVLTDGAFNKYSGDYTKIIAKYQKRNMNLSVVGIKNFPKDEENMREAAKIGNGVYIPVFNLEDAQQNIIREVKNQAFRTRDFK